MKTIATAAVLMMLTVSAWADEAETKQANDPANTNEPIVLSEAEMDGVTAGAAITSASIMGFVGSFGNTLDYSTSGNRFAP
jgi:hypothetical protein